MKTLFFNTKELGMTFDSYANRPKGIVNEPKEGKEEQELQDCISIFITIEKGDTKESVEQFIKETKKICENLKRNKIAIIPFAHLSNNLEEPKKGLGILQYVEEELKKIKRLEVIRGHFGSNKTLHLDVYGHTGNVRFREF